MLAMNSEYEYHIFNDIELIEFLEENISDPDLMEFYKKAPIMVMRTDLWRFMILYKYGGIYMDCDVE